MNPSKQTSFRHQNDRDSILLIIYDAIQHIKENQRSVGDFLSLSSPLGTNFSNGTRYSTTFFTSNILSCIGSFISLSHSHPDLISPHIQATAQTIASRAADFLLHEKGTQGSFNYFTHGEKCSNPSNYPDDLDDTFAALAALHQYKPDLISDDTLASSIKLLIKLEIQEGGPYRTWIAPPGTPGLSDDADIVANSTVGYFLSLIDVRPSRITHYLMNNVENGLLTSPYYPGTCQAIYFLSRYYAADHNVPRVARDTLANHIAEIIGNTSPPILTPLESAMLISSLIYCGRPERIPSGTICGLTDTIQREGWRPYVFCMDPAQNNRMHYAGASALTAAFTAEALMRCLCITQSANQSGDRHPITDNSSHRSIQNMALYACKKMPDDIRAALTAKIEDASDSSITAPSLNFGTILGINGVALPKHLSQNAALAGLYGWLAYDIYDDFLDGEGSPSLLPAANYFLRKLTQIYSALATEFPGSAIGRLFDTSLDRVDAANAWEMTHCRISDIDMPYVPEALPRYGAHHEKLADKSIGYAIGPLTELLVGGYGPDSTEYRAVELFFRHYLIARQLHDDAHDWEKDLLRGCVNSVGAVLIKNYHMEIPSHTLMALSKIILPLREFFWKKTIDHVTKLIHFHIGEARSARASSKFLMNTDYMECQLLKLEEGATEALSERDRVSKFLKHFKSPSL